MIRPQTNPFRLAIALDGWSGAADPDDRGEAEGWAGGIPDARPIAVPGSWNEQFAASGLADHVGAFWYQCRFDWPDLPDRDVLLHFAGVDYRARVWLDGMPLGDSGAPMLPFQLQLPPRPASGPRLLVVRVDNRLPHDGEMPGVSVADYAAEGRVKDEYFPAVRFDFFPYGGLTRPVHLCLVPGRRLHAVRVGPSVSWTGPEGLEASGGRFDVHAAASPGVEQVRASVGHMAAQAPTGATLSLDLPGARLWTPDDPALHALRVEALDADGAVLDRIDLMVGLREVRVAGRQLLLNRKPILLKGFGRHEDAPVSGRTVPEAVLLRDADCLRWTGANSVRNAHYPHSEAWLDLCDRLGILVISEVFSVNLDFRRVTDATLAGHRRAVSQLIARDGIHPCVIAWSLANEPGYLGESAYRERSAPYWRALFAHARTLDPSRPLTHANVQYAGLDDPAFAECDFLSINRYHGWYSAPAQPDRAVAALDAELDRLAAHGKPILVTEFGADALPGAHGFTPQLFTEDYQADLIEAYWRALEQHPSVIGGHVWAFADFRTAQHSRRAVHNLKGVFTRDRLPKLAAHRLKALWA
jgi:beta-glucuronidase